MRLHEIEETMRGPNYDSAAAKFGETNRTRWLTHGQHIGDIENFKLLQDGIYYSLWDNDVLVAFTSLSNSDNTVDDVWVNPQYRGKKIFSMMLWFYKTRLGRGRLILGPVHSQAMQEIVKGMSRFNKYWLNIRTNEKQPFDKDTTDNFYSYAGATPWRLVLENTGDFSDWPKFNNNMSYIKESYLPYVE